MADILRKSEWHPFFELVSRALKGKRAEIEVASLTLGSQIEAEWLPFLGITYDPRDDLVEILLYGVDHLIRNPERIAIESQGALVSAIEVVDHDGTQQILRLRDPMMLPVLH
jgi:hypothetical protein